MKNIKRVMAAEYSRELGVKVHTGQCRIAGLGYRVGGPLNFGLRRELVDEKQRSKGWLTKGEHKALQTDRVRLRLGLFFAFLSVVLADFLTPFSFTDFAMRMLSTRLG